MSSSAALMSLRSRYTDFFFFFLFCNGATAASISFLFKQTPILSNTAYSLLFVSKPAFYTIGDAENFVTLELSVSFYKCNTSRVFKQWGYCS